MRIELNKGWLLQQGEPSKIPMMPQKTVEVDLPHDFTIGSDVRADSKNGANTGYFCGSTVTYTKKISVPEDWAEKRILLYFDGVMGNSLIVVNGQAAGSHQYGYTPFSVDISDYLYYGEENRISVTVSNDAEPGSRWYTGGGLYRGAELLVKNKVHIAHNGLFFYTDHMIGNDAFVIAQATVENHTGRDACLWVEFADAEVGKLGKVKVFVPKNSSAVARTQLCIENAKLWELNDPNLYQFTATLTDGDAVLDAEETTFGIRTISVDAKHGFCLNGRAVKLKGGCLHHDNGILGAASFYEAEYRKLKLHKDNGFNAIRTAHNAASKAFLDACDQLGLMVIEEAFDVWRMHKNYYDFSRNFDDQWQQELTAMVCRDRNHPSIVMWSVGNELPEQGGMSRGYETSAKLTDAVRALDATRPVCGSLCSFFSGLDDKDTGRFWQSLMEDPSVLAGGISNLDSKYGKSVWPAKTEAFAAPWDVVGYNYLDYQYEMTGQKFPNRVICCTESKPHQMESYWADVQKYPYLIGDFCWTSMDYIGEAGIGKAVYTTADKLQTEAQMLHYSAYPWRTAGCGEFDLCGFERPQMAYRRIVWGSKETKIFCRNPDNNGKIELLGRYGWTDCENSWNWNVQPGTPMEIEVYSGGEEVQLLLNGESLGKKATEHLKAVFTVPYTSGELTAIGYIGGEEVSRDTICSGGKPLAVRIAPEKKQGEMIFASVELVDENGNRVPWAEAELTASVEGGAVLQAFGSARPKTEENYCSSKGTTYKGRMLAVLHHTEGGVATLRICADGYGEAVLNF